MGRRARPARVIGWTFCVLGIAAAWQSGRCSAPTAQRPLWQNHNQIAYEFAVRHPGEAYFPWQPLASLFAEGRLYHFEYGMLDRFLAGYEPTAEHVRANVPPRMHWIAGHARLWTMNQFFRDYTTEVPLPELPGFVVRERPGS